MGATYICRMCRTEMFKSSGQWGWGEVPMGDLSGFNVSWETYWIAIKSV